MGIFARAATKAFDQGPGSVAAGRHFGQIRGGKSVTGLSITTDKALRYAAFWSAVRVLSEDIAKLPFGVYRKLPNGGAAAVETHPVNRIVKYRANPETSAFTWRETAMAHLLTWGNGYSLKVRDGQYQLRELWTLATDRMEVDRTDRAYTSTYPDAITGEARAVQFAAGDLRFRYQRLAGDVVELSRAEVLHIPGLSWDGIKGYSVISQARETVGLGLAAEEHGARFFGQGATTNFVLSTDNTLSDDALRRLKAQVKAEKSGLRHAWEPWILEEGLKPQTLSMPNDDAQWLETRKHQVTDIARWFRLPPHKLADLERATFSNIEHQAIEYVTDALLGWVGRFESAMGMQLLGPEWVGAGGEFFLKLNVKALLRGDFKTQQEGLQIARQNGVISADDWRELEDWNPIADGGGTEYLRPLNMVATSAFQGVDGMTFVERFNAVGALARAGYEPNGPTGALAALGLPEIDHTGFVPITVQVDPSTLTTPPPPPAGGNPTGATS